MIKEASEIENSVLQHFDVCIVGAGPAGITLGLALEKRGKSVVLLEAGGLSDTGLAAEMKEGNTNSGLWYNIEGSRLLKLGGTSGHWAGYCAQLDKEDFYANNLWNHKWPLGLDELSPFYQEASQIVEIGSPNIQASDNEIIDLGAQMQEKLWRFSTPVRFGEKYADALKSSKVLLVLNFVATGIELQNETAEQISTIIGLTDGGKKLRFSAQKIVLAQGGIETSRFLLNNEKALGSSMGKAFGQVGHFFADHIHLLNVGSVLLFGQNATANRYRKFSVDGNSYASFFQIKPEVRAKLGFNNLVFRLEWDVEPDHYANSYLAFLQAHKLNKGAHRIASLSVMGEQAPNFESKVTLKEERNALNQRTFDLKWQCTEDDLQAFKKSIEFFGQQLGASGQGRLFLGERYHNERLTKQMFGGNHHLGTARMSENATEGVCDKDGKVWGTNNLYVLGSALFTTYGAANPTLSIVALALRMSQHL